MLFFTSDTHFGHRNIVKYCNRPGLNDYERSLVLAGRQNEFEVRAESVAEMNRVLLDGINSAVGPDDELWHLGDFCFGPKQRILDVAGKFRWQIQCQNIHLIWGNHDLNEIAPLFRSTSDLKQISWGHQRFILCHYAMAIWNKSHKGVYHCYGHSHANAENWLNEIMAGRRSMDVGIDNAFRLLGEYRPFSVEEVMDLLRDRKGCKIDHHA